MVPGSLTRTEPWQVLTLQSHHMLYSLAPCACVDLLLLTSLQFNLRIELELIYNCFMLLNTIKLLFTE